MNRHPYKDFLHIVERPARYAGGEYQSVVKADASIRFALAFPDLYEIGMSHMGFKILYGILNAAPDISAERVFAPWTDLETELRKRNLPLVSLETGRALKDFDLVGFSLQYEMTYTNLLNMLELGGIPIRSVERDLAMPLVVAGGPCAMSPEPLAPFIDVFVIGDGEEATIELARKWTELRAMSGSRQCALSALARVPGLYVPSCYSTEIDDRSDFEVVKGPVTEGAQFPVVRRIIQDINRYPFPNQSPVAYTEVVFDRLSIELARGCTEGCRFCQAGMIYRPVRERDPKQVIDTILSGLDKTGYDEASLTSLSTADYSCVSPLIKELMKELRKRKVKLGVSSLRAYGLSEETLDEMANGKASGLTFAPEAGTQRMRDVISKNITEEEMITTARRVFSRGWGKVKLYFMIGLPTETEEDVIGIAETGKRVSMAGKEAAGRHIEVTVSVSSHVPKPHTPFQWAGMDLLEEVQRKQNLLIQLTKKYRLSFRRHNALISRIEGIISRGDRRIAEVIERAFKKGCRFDGWDEKLKYHAWQEAMTESGVDESIYLRPVPLDGRLPWQHIEVGVTQKFLATEYRRAVQGRLSPPCGKPLGAQVHHTNLKAHEADEKKLICYHCGIACDLSDMRTERAAFLTQLNAIEPLPSKSERSVRKKKDPHYVEPGERNRYRLTFSKLPPISYVSHLDLLRMMPRHFRRAGLTIVETAGYHPKPEMMFAPALSLGISSLGEVIDVVLREKMEPPYLLEALNRVSETGIRYLEARLLGPEEKAISKSVVAADYLVEIPSKELYDVLEQRWNGGNFPPIIREKEGHSRAFSLEEHLLDLRWEEGKLLIRLAIHPNGSVRPGEVVETLSGKEGANWSIVRKKLVIQENIALR